jgi:hypothetical protein
MPIPADRQRIAWDLSRILLPLSFAKRYGGPAAAALTAPAVFFLFSRAGGPEAMILGGALFGFLWWALRFWALKRAARAFEKRFPEWSSERPVALDVLKTMAAEPGAERLYAALPGSSAAVAVEAPVKGPATTSPQGLTKVIEASVSVPGLFGGSAMMETLFKTVKNHQGGVTITQTSVNGKVELLVNGKPVDDPELAELLMVEMEELKASAMMGAAQEQGGQPADQKIQDAVAALATGVEAAPVQGKGTGASQPAGASGSSPQQSASRWMPLQPDEHRPQGEPGENAEGK